MAGCECVSHVCKSGTAGRGLARKSAPLKSKQECNSSSGGVDAWKTQIKERSFVAKNASLDDGQRRVLRSAEMEAEPDRLAVAFIA